MPVKRFLVALGLLFQSLMVAPAVAEPAQATIPCAARADVIKHLSTKYAEAPVSMGLTTDGSVLEIFASKSRSFTIIITRPTGVSCLIASGGNWENLNGVLTGLKI